VEPVDRWLSVLPYVGAIVTGWLMYRASRKQTGASSESDFRTALITRSRDAEEKVDRLETRVEKLQDSESRLEFKLDEVTSENRKLAFQLQLAIVWGQTADGGPPRAIPDWLLGPKDSETR
jgi:hypothetical protein